MSEKEADLVDIGMESLEEFEGCCSWMYCDSRGLVTVGIGHLLRDAGAAVKLPFIHMDDHNRMATDNDKEFAWAKVKAFYHAGLTASGYRAVTDIRLDPAYCRRLARIRLACEVTPWLASVFPEFGDWPLSARLAMVDIAYDRSRSCKGPELLEACINRNWTAAEKLCFRDWASKERNDWTALQFRKAAQS